MALLKKKKRAIGRKIKVKQKIRIEMIITQNYTIIYNLKYQVKQLTQMRNLNCRLSHREGKVRKISRSRQRTNDPRRTHN